MKTLQNHIILFDAECPMCNLYTSAFVSSGMLDVNGRASYQKMPDGVCPLVDKQRAVNEIALVNTQTGEVTYGVQSLFKVIANAIPALRWLFGFGPFVWLARKCYAFISYNRRVIVPGSVHDNSLQPAFSLKHRIAYLIFTWFVTAFILTHYAPLLSGMVPLGGPYREYLICGGQVLFQGIIVSIYAPAKQWNYLGNMMTVSLGGALLLTPLLLAAGFITVPTVVAVLYFLVVAGLMLLEHFRRVKLLGLGWLLSATWLLYRLLLLVFILK